MMSLELKILSRPLRDEMKTSNFYRILVDVRPAYMSVVGLFLESLYSTYVWS